MNNQDLKDDAVFLSAEDVAKILGSSKGFAYKAIKQMNSELEKKGYMILPGKISRRYFEKRWYVDNE